MYKFYELDNIILGDLSPGQIQQSVSFKNITGRQKFDFYDKKLFNVCINVKKEIKSDVFKFSTKQETCRYIQQHFEALLFLSDQIERKLTNNEEEDVYTLSNQFTDLDIYKLIYRYLEVMLNFMVGRFPMYIDMDTRAPVHLARMARFELGGRIEQYRIQLSENKLDDELLVILQEKFNDLSRRDVTIGRINYLKRIFNSITNTIERKKDAITTQDIVDLLYRNNFNSRRFLRYVTGKYYASINEEEGCIGKMEALYRLKIHFTGMTVIKDHCFNNNLPGTEEKMSSWLNEVKDLFMYTLELDQKNETASDLKKIESTLSVEQLGILFRLLNQTQALFHPVKADTFRFICRHVSTRKQDNIAYKSIESKFYNRNSADLEKVKEVVIAMLNILNAKK